MYEKVTSTTNIIRDQYQKIKQQRPFFFNNHKKWWKNLHTTTFIIFIYIYRYDNFSINIITSCIYIQTLINVYFTYISSVLYQKKNNKYHVFFETIIIPAKLTTKKIKKKYQYRTYIYINYKPQYDIAMPSYIYFCVIIIKKKCR